MRLSLTRLPLGCCLWVAVTSGIFSLFMSSEAGADTKQVLVMYSTSPDSPMATAGERELRRILEQGHAEDLVSFAEYLDQGRFPDRAYQDAFSAFLRVKYSGHRIDLIVAIQAAAVSFVSERRDELFPNTPVVFLSLAPLPQRLGNSTAVIGTLDLASTIALAIDLQPETRHIFVVSGSAVPDKEYERLARAQLKPFEGRFDITYLAGLPAKDLEARLSTLPGDSIVYYLVVYEDGAGKAFAPRQYAERVAAAARAPTYTWSDALMDSGVVGGSLLDRVAMMQAAGTVALRVLGGEAADSIPTSSPNLNVSQVDWRQLRRWGISEARVPAGTQVLFKEITPWERYRTYIVGAIALVLAQSVLIAGLLVHRQRRRRAEEQMRTSQAALQTSYERIHDLGSRLLEAQDAERSRIARELHDDISQQVALLAIDLELLNGAVQPDRAAMVEEAVQRTQDIARSVHDLSHRLHPARLRLIGLVSGLEALQRELTRPGIPIVFTHENVAPDLPPDLTLCIFRIAQEALQNAIKYSAAHLITVNLRGESDELLLEIADDGVGFDVEGAWEKGLGLLSMRERLDAVGGTLKIQSRSGVGTRVTIRVHLPVGEPSGTAVAGAAS